MGEAQIRGSQLGMEGGERRWAGGLQTPQNRAPTQTRDGGEGGVAGSPHLPAAISGPPFGLSYSFGFISLHLGSSVLRRPSAIHSPVIAFFSTTVEVCHLESVRFVLSAESTVLFSHGACPTADL